MELSAPFRPRRWQLSVVAFAFVVAACGGAAETATVTATEPTDASAVTTAPEPTDAPAVTAAPEPTDSPAATAEPTQAPEPTQALESTTPPEPTEAPPAAPGRPPIEQLSADVAITNAAANIDNLTPAQENDNVLDIEVLAVGDGSIQTLRDVVVGDRPVLLWFFSPH